MLLRHSVSPALSYPYPSPLKFKFVETTRFSTSISTRKDVFVKPLESTKISCSVSQVPRHNTMDYERRPTVRWPTVYKRIFSMKNPEMGCAGVLKECEDEGKRLTKWELCRVVKELRKYKRYRQALEVYDWMNSKGERFRLNASDAAIQLDLVGKVRGVEGAEDYFFKLPSIFKEKKVYGALLNAYVHAKLKEKAESLMDEMRERGYANDALPFNVMMTLYMNFKEFDQVDSIVSEMMEKNIPLDVYSYNIWLSSHGTQRSLGKMEEVFEQMKLDRTINPSWTTYSTMATMYIKSGEKEKAVDNLRKVESQIVGQGWLPYQYLISLYGSVGDREEVYRIWNSYKANFPIVSNLGYHAMIESLIKIGDIEGAEKIYEEWLPGKKTFDPRIGNLMMGCYVKMGSLEKAKGILNQMIEVGGKPTSITWEILVEGHIAERRICEALLCFKEAISAHGSKNWRPKTSTVSTFLTLCEEQGDIATKEEIIGLLKHPRFLRNEDLASLIGLSSDVSVNDSLSVEQAEIGRINDNDEVENGRSDMLLNQLQGTM